MWQPLSLISEARHLRQHLIPGGLRPPPEPPLSFGGALHPQTLGVGGLPPLPPPQKKRTEMRGGRTLLWGLGCGAGAQLKSKGLGSSPSCGKRRPNSKLAW